MNIKETLDKIKIYRTSPEWKLLSEYIYNSTIEHYDNIDVYLNYEFCKNFKYELLKIEHNNKRIYYNKNINYKIRDLYCKTDKQYYCNFNKNIKEFLKYYFKTYKDYNIYCKLLS